MVLRTELIKPKRYQIKTKEKFIQTENKTWFGKVIIKKEIQHFPDFDAMREYPDEAINYFKRMVYSDGTVSRYLDFTEDIIKIQNKFFKDNHITQSNLIKMEDGKCSFGTGIKVTWDDGNT